MKTTLRIVASILLTTVLMTTGPFCARSAAAEPVLASILKPADFEIYDAEGKQLIGHASYRALTDSRGAAIKGEYRYFDGQWDVEEERLKHVESEAMPHMIEFNRTFYGADGAMERRTTVNLETGDAACEVYKDDPQIHTANLSFPADTFAGASLLIPLVASLRDPSSSRVRFHVFTCVPEPRVIAIDTPVNREASRWPLYPGGTAVKLEVEPDLGFGLLNLIAAPFLPKILAWFDPLREWDYAGGSNLRFYRGPRITLVRNITGNVAPGNRETIRAKAAVSPSLHQGSEVTQLPQNPSPRR